jgi:hypothetical protein
MTIHNVRGTILVLVGLEEEGGEPMRCHFCVRNFVILRDMLL